MRWLFTITVLIGFSIFGGCSKKAAVTPTGTGQQATITLKNGSGFAGTVTSSSKAAITLLAPNGESRTYPMEQVDTIHFEPGAAAGAPAVASTPAPASSTPAPMESAPPSSPSSSASNTPPPAQTAAPTVVERRPAPVRESRPTPPPAPREIVSTVPAGTHLSVRNNETIDSKTAAPGQTYSGVVVRNVMDREGRVVIPQGSAATLVVRSSTDQGRIKGQSELALDIAAVSIQGRRYRVETSNVVQTGRSGLGKNKRTATFLGGGTALGALLGAVAGGGKGAAIGALSGAAAGTATQAITRGHGVRVPAETLMTFRLEAPIRIREDR